MEVKPWMFHKVLRGINFEILRQIFPGIGGCLVYLGLSYEEKREAQCASFKPSMSPGGSYST
jgi:hypothetical protein